MADEATKKSKLEVVSPATPKDALDIEALWLDPGLGDDITDTHWHKIPIGKPRNFFRAHPDKSFRRKTEIYVHKPEDAGGAPVRHCSLYLPRRQPASVADHVPACGREGQHRLDFGTQGRTRGDRHVGEAGMGRAIVRNPSG